MKSFLVWLPALIAYAAFLAWYWNWEGPLRADEIAKVMRQIEANGVSGAGQEEFERLRKFLDADDGREFFMLNLVRLAPGDVRGPDGTVRPARQVVEDYTKVFMPALFARGGHPAIVARKVGGYFDAWGVEPDPGWTIIGYMRYRSRRDLAMLITDPRFGGAHAFKFAAMPQTLSFPTQPQLQALVSPTIWVGLALALVAALGQIAWLILGRS